ncbi:MAG: glycosyltransferase family 4 protein [Sedimentisphaerales bacterium]|jgi:glycosyltransferase involved in cell wall biosynthesis
MTNTKEPPKKIKVCFVAPKAYPIFNPAVGDYFGGAEIDLYYLATEFARDNSFEVSFVVADYGQKDVEIIENVTVLKSLDFSRNPLNGLLRTWHSFHLADADIYVMKCASAGAFLVALFCKIRRRIYVYRLASLLESDGTYIRQHPIVGRLFAWSLHQAKFIFAQNAIDAQNLNKTLGMSSHVIPNGHRLPPSQHLSRDTVLWVGRDDPVKNPELFLDLAKSAPNERFVMVCQTFHNDLLYAELVARAGAIPNLQFIRHVPFNQIDAYFQRAKVFVNTSDSEGFPNTFIQAGKAGSAILSFKVNPDDFLDKYHCGLTSGGDFDRMVHNLRSMLENNRYVELGANGRRYVEQHHDITKIAAEYKSIFARLVDKKHWM